MNVFKKIKLNEVDVLNDSEMKHIKGTFGEVGPCRISASVPDCMRSECFVSGLPGKCQVDLYSYGSAPDAQLGYRCICVID